MQAWCDEQTEMLNDLHPVIPTPAPAAPAWPSCPLHGPHYAAGNGQPMNTCERCEKYRFA